MNEFKFIVDLLAHRISAISSFIPDKLILDFKTYVLDDGLIFPDFKIIEELRSGLLKRKDPVLGIDNGAGSRITATEKTIGRITGLTSVAPRFGRLLYRMANLYRPAKIIELGTSTGISTIYLASGSREAEVITVEGNPQLAGIASDIIKEAGLTNVTVLNLLFDDAMGLPAMNIPPGSLVFIDGNHTSEATQRYFNFFSGTMGENSILVFDDINWSPGMQTAWKNIRQNTFEGTFIDLFFMGIYFSNSSVPKRFVRFNY